MRHVNLDMDVLRTLVTGVELGSFAKAAERLGRSTSAVSAQLKKLQEQAGEPVLRKAGRGMELTPAGEALLGYAQRLLALNDEALHAVRDADLQGEVRLGLQEDFGESLLVNVLGGFARAHPRVHVQARLGRNAELITQAVRGRLDLALAWDSGHATPHMRRVARLPLQWIGSAATAPVLASDTPVPLAVLESPCLLRSVATTALDQARRPWRPAFTSTSLAGIWAAVDAGLGITVRTRAGLPPRLQVLRGLPRLPSIGLDLHRATAEPTAAVRRLEELLLDNLKEALAPARTEPAARRGTRAPG